DVCENSLGSRAMNFRSFQTLVRGPHLFGCQIRRRLLDGLREFLYSLERKVTLAIRLAVENLKRQQFTAIVFHELFECLNRFLRAVSSSFIRAGINNFVLTHGIDCLFVASFDLDNCLTQFWSVER